MTNRQSATHILTTTLLLIVAANVLHAETTGQRSSSTPKLIIGISVDQLRTDYLYALESKFDEGGLRLLMDKGIVYEKVVFDIDNPDAASALATLATGSYPFSNGVTSKDVFNTAKLRRQSIFYDKDFIGNFTEANYSARALTGTTIADELKTASSGTSRIYSIAPDAEEAIIGAGHTGNGAFWIDDKDGKWASTTYYKDFPHYLERKNKDKPMSYVLSEAVWEPMQPGDGTLSIMPYHYATKPFSHTFYQYGQPCYAWFKSSPLVNDAIVEFSKILLTTGSLGQGRTTDMLQLTFYCGTWLHEEPELYAAELQDIYLRLDRSLKNLFELVDKQVGLNNTVIYLTGTGQTTTRTTDVEGTRLGVFTATRCTSLLNSYLISVYGQGQYVVDYADNQIYLDHRAIEQKGLKLADVQRTAAEFVMMFSGVDDVVTQYQILHQDDNERIRRMRRSYSRLYGGDLVVSLLPGWVYKYKDQSEERPQTRHDIAPGPAILFAPDIIPERITTPVDATVIAPTVAAFIRIRAPSGARHPGLQTTIRK
ncbi:MAG: alkaline phosphatase family protein [Bacteroidales bacterium]|nr:alkaline phosphatase family protein [Candidatus Liminaster caballi]